MTTDSSLTQRSFDLLKSKSISRFHFDDAMMFPAALFNTFTTRGYTFTTDVPIKSTSKLEYFEIWKKRKKRKKKLQILGHRSFRNSKLSILGPYYIISRYMQRN